MADGGGHEKLKELARAHHLAAAQHDSAAHHHREAAFHLAAGDGTRAKQHSISATEHAAQAQAQAANTLDSPDDYDLDVDFETLGSQEAQPEIRSIILCTPGCEHTGSGNSFCCAANTDLCTISRCR